MPLAARGPQSRTRRRRTALALAEKRTCPPHYDADQRKGWEAQRDAEVTNLRQKLGG